MASTDTQQEGHLDSVLDSSDNIVVVLDGNGKIARISRGTKQILGYDEDELFGTSVFLIVPPDRRGWMSAISKRAREDGVLPDVFIHWLTKDGRRLISKSTLRSVVDYQQNIVGTIISEDAAPPKEGEGTMTPQQAMDLVQASEITMIVTDLSGNVISFSSGAQELTGFHPGQVVGSGIGRLFSDREVLGDISIRALRDGKVEDFETRMVTADDNALEVSVSISVRRNPSGAAIGFSFVIFDIAKRKELEHELELRADKLRLVNELATKIRSGKNLKEIHTVALEGLSRIVEFDMMTLALTSSADDELRITFVEGEHPAWLSTGRILPLKNGPFGRAMTDGLPVFYASQELNEVIQGYSEDSEEFWTGAVFPLFAGERALGFLNFLSSSGNAMGSKEQDFVTLVADHIALAVESERLFSALMENINIQTILMEVGTAVRSEINLERAYPTAAQRVQEMISADGAALYMLEEGKLSIKASEGILAEGYSTGMISDNDPGIVTAHFFGSGKAFARDISTFEGVTDSDRKRFSSAMMAKLIGREGPMGLIIVARKNGGPVFTPYDFELLNLFSNHLSPALENTRLFEEMRKSEETARKALESERRIMEALNFIVEMFAHDSQNQIQGILGYLELIGRSDIPAEAQEYIEKAMRQVRAGSSLISGTALVFENISLKSGSRNYNALIRALKEAEHRFSMIFPNIELTSIIPQLETEKGKSDALLSELFFHVIRMMHRASTNSKIDISLRDTDDPGKFWVEFKVQAMQASSGKLARSLQPYDGSEGVSTRLLDPFIVRILSEIYGAKISAMDKEEGTGKGIIELACVLEFEVTR